MENEIKVGDKYKGKVNGAIFEITGIDEKNKIVFYKWNDKIFHHGLDSFKKCLLEKCDKTYKKSLEKCERKD